MVRRGVEELKEDVELCTLHSIRVLHKSENALQIRLKQKSVETRC